MTAEQLSVIAGAVLSLLFEYFPGLAAWYAGLDKSQKQLTMLVVLFATSAVIYALGCIPSSPVHAVTCDVAGFWTMLEVFLITLLGNQVTHMATKNIGRG